MFGLHIHKWGIISSRQGTISSVFGISCKRPIVLVLYKCKVCGKLTTKEYVEGNWSQEELERT